MDVNRIIWWRQIMHKFRILTAAVLAVILLMTMPAALAEEDISPPAHTVQAENGILRVYMKSLGNPDAIGLTLNGSYAVEGDSGFRFSDGAKITVAAVGKELYLQSGGLVISMGDALTFTRHAAEEGQKSGMYIHASEKDNLFVADLQLSADDGGIVPVLLIDVEEYLYGVVPYEMSDSFPIEALKAQAVAARTYALERRASAKSRAYDVVDTTADQVFKGFDPNCEHAIAAVDATKGVVGWYKDTYATCYFSASNGGQTAMPNHIWGYEGDYGYLDIRDDPYDLENPSSIVKSYSVSADGALIKDELTELIKAELTEQLATAGYSDDLSDFDIERVLAIEPVSPKFEDGSRLYDKLKFTMTVKARAWDRTVPETPVLNEKATVAEPFTVELGVFRDFKKKLGMKISVADCELVSVISKYPEAAAGVEIAPDATPIGFVIELRRFGHGVGLSQRGAQTMAGQYGKTWRDILAFYYPNMELRDMQFAASALTNLSEIPTTFGHARPRPTPKPTPAPLPKLESGQCYAKVVLGSKSSTLNVRMSPAADAKVKDVLNHNQRVVVMDETADGWAHIRTAEMEGYVAKEFLVKE